MVDVYEQLSEQRKKEQAEGLYPDWFTTGSYQMFKESYQYEATGYREQVERIAKTLAPYAPDFSRLKPHPLYETITTNHGNSWEECFLSIMWTGDFAPSTPVLANTGTDRGCSVSCSGSVIGDSVRDFYESLTEAALLSKEGFGTSAYLGKIRPRGSKITNGGKATGTFPVLKTYQEMASRVSQGGVRRGSWAGYLPIDHDDFDEWCDSLIKDPQGQNIGWVVTRAVIQKWEEGDEELTRRRARALYAKLVTGKGYFWKVDHVNEQQPEAYKAHGLLNHASNLCTEITLFADFEHTYTCIISSMNCLRYDIWKDTGSVFIAIVLLDALCSEFLEKARNIVGLEKAVRYTEKARSLGLGLLGFHSYLQSKMIAFEEYEAHRLNIEIFSHLHDESLAASQWIASVNGEPEWCKGLGVAHTHLTAVAPNMSSAVLCGQVSNGIEPWLANAFLQPTAAGEMLRINPEFLKLATSKGKYNKALVRDIIQKKGSVQHLDWLTDHEKLVFRTAFEIDQFAILRLASLRQRYMGQYGQGQSLNFFFSSEAPEEYVAAVYKEFFLDEYLKGQYYLRSESGVLASNGECLACSS